MSLEGLEFSRRRIDIRLQRGGPVRREERAYRATSGLDVSVAREADVGAIIRPAAMGLGAASVQGVSFSLFALGGGGKRSSWPCREGRHGEG